MTTSLLHNARLLITMNDAGDRIPDGALVVRDNAIQWVGPTKEVPVEFLKPDCVIDATDLVVLPGLINTHHHFYQTLTRAMAPDSGLFDWLKTLYPIWAGMNGEAIYVSAQIAMAEMILSGCTTSSDHLYILPNGAQIDDEIRAAQEIGMRFHAARGSMSLGESQGGLPPDSVVENEADILRDCQRLIETYHDPEAYAMVRVVLAPCSPFSVSPDLMRESVSMARAYGVHLHTHIAETIDEEAFCLSEFGHRPAAYAEELGWVGDDVWWAHSIHVDDFEINMMAKTGTGAAHCPGSNMRLASGVAPVRKMIDAGLRIGLGVDGSASNDSSHVLAEARLAMLLQRVLGGATALTGAEALQLATRGGAEVLGRDDIGQLAPGKAADIIGVDLNSLDYAGAQHDPMSALVFCQPQRVDLSIINGRIVVEDGQLTTVDVGAIVEKHNAISLGLIRGEPVG